MTKMNEFNKLDTQFYNRSLLLIALAMLLFMTYSFATALVIQIYDYIIMDAIGIAGILIGFYLFHKGKRRLAVNISVSLFAFPDYISSILGVVLSKEQIPYSDVQEMLLGSVIIYMIIIFSSRSVKDMLLMLVPIQLLITVHFSIFIFKLDDPSAFNRYFFNYIYYYSAITFLAILTIKQFKINNISFRVLTNHKKHLEDTVTERTRELNEKNEKLLQSEELRKRLLANISHDIGTPLTTIHMFIRALQDRALDTNNMDQVLNVLNNEVLYVNRLLLDLSEISKIESGQLQFFNEDMTIATFINKIKEQYETKLKLQNVDFRVNNQTDASNNLLLNIDFDRIIQVFNNIVNNALKYVAHTSPKIHINIVQLEHQVEFQISDNGNGIEEKDLPYIFDRFFRDENKKGRGLGLYISKEIMNVHGGEMWVTSKINVGTTVHLSLPFYLQEENAQQLEAVSM